VNGIADLRSTKAGPSANSPAYPYEREVMTMDTCIEPACPDDASDVLRLLERSHLPLDGLLDHLPTIVVARRDGEVIGSAALEVYADGALLRSVAVAPEAQGHGLGHDLVAAAIRMAEGVNAPAIYLLTTTAAQYFPKFGFEAIARKDVPAGVQTSIEFTSACPASAAVLRKRL
jgi:amino-acid N-acetyltransferase